MSQSFSLPPDMPEIIKPRFYVIPLWFFCPLQKRSSPCFICSWSLSCIYTMRHGYQFLSRLFTPISFTHFVRTIIEMELTGLGPCYHPRFEFTTNTFTVSAMLIRYNSFWIKDIRHVTSIFPQILQNN